MTWHVRTRRILGLLVALTGLAIAPAQAEEYPIGLLAGLSGGGAQIGQWMVRGAEVAIENRNKAGETTFRLVPEDTQWNAQKTVEAFNKVVNVDGAQLVLVGGSSPLQAVAPIADQTGVIIFNVGAQSPAVAGIGRNLFHSLQLSDVDIRVMARYAHDTLGLRRLATMYVNNDTGKFTQEEFANQFEASGGEVVARESFNQNDSNFGVQLAKIRAAGPDSIYLVGTPAELPFAARQIRQVMPDVPIVSYAGIESREFLEAAGEAGHGIVYSTTHFDPASEDPRVREFVAAYAAKYGETPTSPYVTYTYDAVNVIADALEATGGEAGEALREKILEVRRFPGVTGDTVFRDDGTVTKTIAIKEITSDGFTVREIVEP